MTPEAAGSGSFTLVGFDSAWADNPKKPGAFCAMTFADGHFDPLRAPSLVGFDQAVALIKTYHREDRPTLVAIDQPTIVPNEGGMRPVERAIASVISWTGGGMQPAYRGKTALFGDGAPIWRFKDALRPEDDPEPARSRRSGLFLLEVYPALALLSLHARFFAPGKGPRYNPQRKTFRLADWQAAIDATAAEADRLGCTPAGPWLASFPRDRTPSKADQDRLDAVLCLLVALRWRSGRPPSVMVGDLRAGYVVAPLSEIVRPRLALAAAKAGVPMLV